MTFSSKLGRYSLVGFMIHLSAACGVIPGSDRIAPANLRSSTGADAIPKRDSGTSTIATTMTPPTPSASDPGPPGAIPALLGAGSTTSETTPTAPGAMPTTPSTTPNTPGTMPPAPGSNGANVMELTVNGSLCGANSRLNQPCTSVTICQHGTTTCQTINNILLDTGSSGLRLFSSLVTVPVVPVTVGGQTLAECITYTGAASQWGSIATVDVILGHEPAVQVPIQLINQAFASPPPACTAAQSQPDTSPEEAGFNGLLGVGLFSQDCGPLCTRTAGNGMYYQCTGTNCVGATTTVQVGNPVARLPTDNNGVILKLPSVPDTGAVSVNGSVILGIGTQTNNIPTGATGFPTNGYGYVLTRYGTTNAAPISSFIDSGSSIMIVPPDPSVARCAAGSQTPGFFCPNTNQTAAATIIGAPGSPSANVTFSIGNAPLLLSSKNQVLSNLVEELVPGQNNSAGNFDWGLPFFFGRSVYIGIDQQKSALGVGPYYGF